MATFLKLSGIGKRFGSFTALDAVDLEIDKGEFVCFLGPSGCGKTTLLRIIAGLETQSGGRIEQAGRDISLLPPAQRDYGIVFQSYALFPNLTVADNVAYGLEVRGVKKLERLATVLRENGVFKNVQHELLIAEMRSVSAPVGGLVAAEGPTLSADRAAFTSTRSQSLIRCATSTNLFRRTDAPPAAISSTASPSDRSPTCPGATGARSTSAARRRT